jgi:hypothetical protein
VSQSNQNISYPPPQLDSGSLKQVRTGYSEARGIDLVLDTSTSVTINFNGENLSPAESTVTYGTLPDVSLYECNIVLGSSSMSTLTCTTAVYSQGTELYFRVSVSGQSVVSDFRITFPTTPFIDRVSGCMDNGNATFDCPTVGGPTLTVYGYAPSIHP